jgi:prephenate dehydrogenase
VERIAIIGLGLIGGSIGLALKRAGLRDIEISGTARTRDTLLKAKKLGIIDIDEPLPSEAVRGAKLVIIATPILAIEPVMREIAPALAENAVVTDAGSTKENVARWARDILPRSGHFVGGHPMAGKESFGVDAADPDLFRGRTWVICPSVDAPEGAVNTVLAVVQACGAEATFMDAAEHDSYVAAISHLPLTVAAALFSVASTSAAWPELARLASSGFRDTSRLASGSPEMAHDIAMTNRDNLLHWIDRFQDELSRFRRIVATGESAELLEAFARPQMERDTFMEAGAPSREVASAKIEGLGLGDMLLGTKISGYLKKQQDMIKDMESREKKR